jgi:hypothetical protein
VLHLIISNKPYKISKKPLKIRGFLFLVNIYNVNRIMSKIILTTEQSKKLFEHIMGQIVINEGAWEEVKYALSKFGRYKAGGQIFGKDKIDSEAAKKIQSILDNKANQVIKDLDNRIKDIDPKFPNNKSGAEFLRIVVEIAAVYDTLVANTHKSTDEKGYVPVDVANAIINDLREYVKKFLDIDLKSIYSVVDEVTGGLNISEEELKQLDEDLASDVRKNLQAKRGGGEDFQSDRMSTLKSNKLPVSLTAIGASLGAFNWLVNTDWFKHLFETVTPDNVTDAIAQQTEVLNDIKPGEGLYKLIGRVTNTPLDGNSNPAQFVEALKQVGGGDAHKGVDLLCQQGGVMMNPQEAAQGLHDLVDNPNQYQTIGDMFQGGSEASGSGKISPINSTLYGTISGRQLATILVQKIPGIVLKGGIKVGAGYAAAKGLANVLGPIGVGTMIAGALVKVMRMKGQKQSRAKTLNDLYQSIRNIEGGVGIIPQTSTTDDNSLVTRGTSDTNDSKSIDDIYFRLRNLFQFIVNNKKMLGFTGGDNVGTGAAMRNQKMRVGDTYNYNGLNVKILNPDIGDGRTQVQSLGKAKNVFTVKTDTLQRLNEEVLSEGKYITDKRLLQFLNKNLSFDKLKSFEGLIDMIEKIRDRVKSLDPKNDKVLAGFIEKYKKNPIMVTDFAKMFNVSADKPQEVNSLKAFIDDLFVTVYSGKYKFNSMIDKMGSLGGGNINKVTEEAGYNSVEPSKAFIKDAQDRRMLKKNILAFLETSIGLFQYLHKLKTQKSAQSQNKAQQGPQQPKG